jgi:hypothetical protein
MRQGSRLRQVGSIEPLEVDPSKLHRDHFRCASFTIQLRRVEGKQCLEGELLERRAHARTRGTVFYEWN